jgi:hypothetical protein
MSYERVATANESPYTWTEGESLSELSKPKRIKGINKEHAECVQRLKAQRQENPLRPSTGVVDHDEIYGQAKI